MVTHAFRAALGFDVYCNAKLAKAAVRDWEKQRKARSGQRAIPPPPQNVEVSTNIGPGPNQAAEKGKGL